MYLFSFLSICRPYIDPPGAGHHHTLVPYADSLQQSQQLTLHTNVQTCLWTQ